MNGAYLDLVANAGKAAITHIGLTDTGVELDGGSYARKAVTWTGPTTGDGTIRPDGNLVFDVPAGATVDGWSGFTADEGGTEYGGAALDAEAFTNAGTYTLLAASSGIVHDTP